MHRPQATFGGFSLFHSVTTNDVKRFFEKMNKTFCALDPLDVSELPAYFEQVGPLIAAIINGCFNFGVFPPSEKKAVIRPLLKKSGLDRENLANYRPVSNLTLLSKIIEVAILEQLGPYLEANKLIPSLQSAYRSYHSTETALCRVYNDLLENKCRGSSSLLIMLDLSSAFDTIDHELLLKDLAQFGMSGRAMSLLHSYLKNRTQMVQINDSISESTALTCGVPQGSVLGPILFLIYAGGLSEIMAAHNVRYHLYADDTQIYLPIINIPEVKSKVVLLLADIKLWMNQRRLKLNDGKTEMLLIKSSIRSNVSIQFGDLNLNGVAVSPSETVKDIGVSLDEALSFKYHINTVVRNCNFHIRNIYSVRKNLDRESTRSLVTAMISSRVDYCCSLFLGLPNKQLKKLQVILNRAARLIFQLKPRDSPTASQISLHWLPIKARIEFKVCLITYKVLKFKTPAYLCDLLSPYSCHSAMTLRQSDDIYRLNEPRAIGEKHLYSRSFSYSAPRMYNKLPGSLKKIESLDLFKKQLKAYLFDKAYNVREETVTQDYKL